MAASRSEALSRGRATYQDVIDAPAHQVAEIVDGTLYTHPRPAPPHAIASSVLGGELNPPFHRGRGGPGGWWILNEPELHLGEDLLVPDLAGWRRERMLEPPDTAYFPLAPDWACEVLSASTRRLDLQGLRYPPSLRSKRMYSMSFLMMPFGSYGLPKKTASAHLVLRIGNLVPDDWRKIVEANPPAAFLDARVERKDEMPSEHFP